MTNELRFDGQVAVVTGAGGGLGKQYALLLAARGARIVVNDTGGSVAGDGSNIEAAHAAAEEIRRQGGQAVADTHSVTSPEGGQAIVDTALRAWGRVDIVINNAGIVGDAPFEEMTADRLNPLMDVHLKGAFYVTRPAWTVMREQRYGRILNTCSAAGILGAERMSNYGAAKTGLIGFTRVLAAEGAERNIKVNAIAPIAYTRMLAHSVDGAASRMTRRRGRCSMTLWANIFRSWIRHWWPRWRPSSRTGSVRFPERSTRSAPGMSRGSSSAGRRVSTVPGYPSRTCATTCTRSATKPVIPCPADPPTR